MPTQDTFPESSPKVVDEIGDSESKVLAKSKKRKRSDVSGQNPLSSKIPKKRGPKPGFKRPSHWAKPGRKPKEKLAEAYASLAELGGTTDDIESVFSKSSGKLCLPGVDDGWEAVAFTIQVSRKEAFSGPDRERFLVADSLEKAQLEALETWRPIRDSDRDFTDKLELIPSMVIYTKKRPQPGETEGRCKARLVAIGCR